MRLRNGNGRADIESLVKEFAVRVGIMCPKGSIEDTFLGSVQLLKGWCREGVIKSARKECETNGGFES